MQPTNMKKSSSSLAIREMQIKITLRHHLIPVRMAITKKSRENRWWRGCGETGTLLHFWWECKLVQPLWKTVWQFLKDLKAEIPFDPAIPLLGFTQRKISYYTKTILAYACLQQHNSQFQKCGTTQMPIKDRKSVV